MQTQRTSTSEHYRDYEEDAVATIPVSNSNSSNSSPRSCSAGMTCIEHRVTRMDTLAGIAIKYGVEVGDIKQLNGLVTDRQMYAHKMLQIPLPGKHPPSPLSARDNADDGEYTFKKPPPKISRAMSSLQGFYGLTTTRGRMLSEGSDFSHYMTANGYLDDDGSLTSSQLSGRHRKSQSLAICYSDLNAYNEKASETSENSDNDRSIRRRQKADAKRTPRTPEILLKDDTSNDFVTRIARGLALRLKSTSRTEAEAPKLNAAPSRNSVTDDRPSSVRKSMSTPTFLDTDKSSSKWATARWALRPELIARPIVDGLPKSINIRRIKAALD